jgi:hypothetical protein
MEWGTGANSKVPVYCLMLPTHPAKIQNTNRIVIVARKYIFHRLSQIWRNFFGVSRKSGAAEVCAEILLITEARESL